MSPLSLSRMSLGPLCHNHHRLGVALLSPMSCHRLVTTVVMPSLLNGTTAMTNAISLDLGHNAPVTVEHPALLARACVHILAVKMSITFHSPSALRFLSSTTSLPLIHLCRNVPLLHDGAPM